MKSPLPKSMTSRLTVAIIMAALLPTLLIGWVAISYVFDSIKQNKIKDVGFMASIRHDQLNIYLHQAKAQAELFLAEQTDLCGFSSGTPTPEQLTCLDKALTAYVHTEAALGGELSFAGRDAVVMVGVPTKLDHAALALRAGQLALFPPASAQASRVFHLPAHNDRHQMQLVMTYPVSALQNIFAPPRSVGSVRRNLSGRLAGLFHHRAALSFHPRA